MCFAFDEYLREKSEVNERMLADLVAGWVLRTKGEDEGSERVTYRSDVHIAVPPQPDRFCAFCLLEAAKVKFEVFIVEVDRGDSYQQEQDIELIRWTYFRSQRN